MIIYPESQRNTGSCTYVFLILCSISVWDLFLVSVLTSVGTLLFCLVFCFSLYKSEAMACEMFWINRCYLYLNLLAGVVYKAFGVFSGAGFWVGGRVFRSRSLRGRWERFGFWIPPEEFSAPPAAVRVENLDSTRICKIWGVQRAEKGERMGCPNRSYSYAFRKKSYLRRGIWRIWC